MFLESLRGVKVEDVCKLSLRRMGMHWWKFGVRRGRGKGFAENEVLSALSTFVIVTEAHWQCCKCRKSSERKAGTPPVAPHPSQQAAPTTAHGRAKYIFPFSDFLFLSSSWRKKTERTFRAREFAAYLTWDKQQWNVEMRAFIPPGNSTSHLRSMASIA